jgi:hypothetical protein
VCGNPKVLDHVVNVGKDAHEGNRFADSTHGCQGSAGSPHALQTESALGTYQEWSIVLWGKVGSASANPDVVRRPWRALQFLTCETGGQVWCFAVMLRCCWSLGEVDWDFRMPGELDCKLRTI